MCQANPAVSECCCHDIDHVSKLLLGCRHVSHARGCSNSLHDLHDYSRFNEHSPNIHHPIPLLQSSHRLNLEATQYHRSRQQWNFFPLAAPGRLLWKSLLRVHSPSSTLPHHSLPSSKFTFFTGPDPTRGSVEYPPSLLPSPQPYISPSYVNKSLAFGNNLTYVQDDGIVVMKGDDKNWLPDGQFRQRYLSFTPCISPLIFLPVFAYLAYHGTMVVSSFSISTMLPGAAQSGPYVSPFLLPPLQPPLPTGLVDTGRWPMAECELPAPPPFPQRC